MDENVKEFLGIGKHDFWYYPGLAMAIGSFWVSSPAAVVALLVISTGLLVVFLVKSTPRYLGSRELHRGTRVFGLVGNIFLVLMQIAIVVFRVLRLS
ncbi:hypothetical protein BE21_20725 [Sorangium cellulosum]|uniref:Uncharacterized protein n=1 Tax=Sorangium cellulosum TaxID=56 RepID=A0A150TW76_SORCE|nr:hypothetical protein BE21_20725 [Sorangium cellulosum]